MKIVFVASGKSVHTHRWVNAMSERGHRVWLISNDNDQDSQNQISNDVEKITLPFSGKKGYYLNALYLKKWCSLINPDVINAHYASGYGTLLRLSGLAEKSVLSVWGSDIYEFPYRNNICMGIIKKNLLSAKCIAATSKNMIKQVKMLAPVKNVFETPFGIDINKFYRVEKTNKQIEICTIKTLEKNYRVDYFIKSIALLVSKLDKEGINAEELFKVSIYGEGAERENLARLISYLSLDNIVELKGYVQHEFVPRVLSKMDIFVALSEKESFGVSVLEASAARIPVVVSDALGFSEIVKDSISGFIVKDGNPEIVSEKIYILMKDEKLRETMGKNGHELVEKFYSWDKCVEMMEKVYLCISDES